MNVFSCVFLFYVYFLLQVCKLQYCMCYMQYIDTWVYIHVLSTVHVLCSTYIHMYTCTTCTYYMYTCSSISSSTRYTYSCSTYIHNNVKGVTKCTCIESSTAATNHTWPNHTLEIPLCKNLRSSLFSFPGFTFHFILRFVLHVYLYTSRYQIHCTSTSTCTRIQVPNRISFVFFPLYLQQ